MLNKCLRIVVERRTLEMIDSYDNDTRIQVLHDNLNKILLRLKNIVKDRDDLQAVDEIEAIVNCISIVNIETSYSSGFYDGLELGRDMSCPQKRILSVI